MDATTRLVRQGTRIAYANAGFNVALTAAKGLVGAIAHSDALIADAVHSASDLVGSLAVIIGLRIARKPPDEDHPYGHGKAELIASIVVAGLLIAAAIDVGVSSISSFMKSPKAPELAAAEMAFVAIVVKELLFRYNVRIGRRLQSKSLMAQAYDHRSDVYSSLAALVGIVLAIIGERLRIRWLMYMDAAAGLFVACLVLKMAIHIAQDSLQSLMDRVVLEEAALHPYREQVMQVHGVRAIDELRVRDHGQYVIVDIEIAVDGDITVFAGHEIAAEVRRVLREKFARVQDVFVHVNPYEVGDERREGNRDCE
ncbi:cation transporter [Alicyclobacillus hesperidum subsp. aegles]|uniref:cation diffusion facilitator family transporter n=1 Tax=Alicyclobacillus hesperidum TaxID=89784 RepID=UPI000AB52A73|nr:cation diffusion facilitator family transporter [Alicyclobacillus hesperidum]GLG02224.1 cation transporter [Alicyclobacillus hesperidum subsp. aegles]